MTAPRIAAIDLNSPGTYLHWSIFDISVANLVVIAVMVAIFGAALLLPFPRVRHLAPTPAEVQPDAVPQGERAANLGDDADARMWTSRARRWALRTLPPRKLLPDRQPAYVASWVYVFGVATLAALGLAIVSGFAIAIGGTDWWHTNPVGHFFNSMHLWSVELFMAFMVIHLWGKFWMAAWRGRRAMTWITGVVAFGASIVECFTGYLAQQNFDSQWIATNGKDAFNAAGVGAFFNVMNFGQMLLWHVVLVPIILIALVGAHVLLVRVRGVSHPLPAKRAGWRDRAARRAAKEADAAPWRGPTRRYDILKEGTIATAIALALVLIMAGVLSSPDVPSVSVQSWAKVAPADFLGTAAAELNGTALAASYGPPYNNGTAAVQQVGPVNWQTLSGVTQPIDAASAFVLSPLSKLAPTDPALASALGTYHSATQAQQQGWATAYGSAVTKVKFVDGAPVVPKAADGPVPAMMSAELTMARSGALDADLLAQRQFYGTDYTKPLLFIADGEYYANQAQAMHLTGDQWGVMNETGSYPGQPWLWLYQLWYHVAPFSNSPAVDVWAVYLTGIATLLLLAIPFIPGLRDIPRLIPVHRLIWRSGVSSDEAGGGTGPAAAPVGSATADRPA
ncbi:MAG: cytochrome b N-terminal domain-containing protein [Actinobacteria bacterium]|nr:cytochrome b N-terminal domain-containing protein [Actinomycetota bacterium]